MSAAVVSSLLFFLSAGYLMWTGSGEIWSRTITTRHRSKRSRVVREYTLTHGIVPFVGWIKLAWSVPILIMGVQIMLGIHPLLVDMVMPSLKTLLKMPEKRVTEILFFISMAILLLPDLVAMLFGESEIISRGRWMDW